MQQILDQQLKLLEKTVASCEWENPLVYGNYLAQTYYYVCHSTRLLGLSASYFQIDRDSLHRRFATHMSEEKGHEKLCLSDLRHLKLELSQFPELGRTRAFYESQYYKIQYENATSLFGYILLLEGAAVRLGPQIYERVSNSHGKAAGNFLRIHVEEDPDHVDQALESIMALPPQDLTYIEKNMVQSADLFGAMLEAMAKPQVLRVLKAA